MTKIALTFPLIVFLVLCQCSGSFAKTSKSLVHINDDNWDQILKDEWMVEFFAPWCPACRSLQPVWEEFSSWGPDLGIQIGQVDITSSPGLSGRFMITALPTIFHVKDGQFRQYKGSRTKEEFLSFVEEKKWEGLDAVSSWQSPSSVQMTVVSQFYKVSMGLRNLMNVMLEEYGIPAWSAYLIFGVATILIGLVLGLILVCIIDCIYPPSSSKMVPRDAGDSKDKDTDDEFTEEIQDEESQDEGEEEKPEEKAKKSPSKESNKEDEPSTDSKSPGSPKASGSARRRKRLD